MAFTAQIALDRPILVAEWEALEDPDGGRLEVLDGRLVVTPSANADHSRHGEICLTSNTGHRCHRLR